MKKSVNRSMSYSTVRKSRRIEISCIALTVVLVFVGTLAFIFVRREKRSNPTKIEKCGPNFPDFSVNITGAEKDGESYSVDGMSYPPGAFWFAGGSVFGCPCSVKACIRKCCSPDQNYDPDGLSRGKLMCVDSNTTSFKPLNLPVFPTLGLNESVEDLEEKVVGDDHFFILHERYCESYQNKGLFMMDPGQYTDEQTFLMEDGSVLIFFKDPPPVLLDQSNYCLESFLGSDIIYTMECVGDNVEYSTQQKEGWLYTVLAVGMLASVPFLLLTLAVYALIPQLQNLHGKSLMCHVTCLAVAYVALAIIQLTKDYNLDTNACIVLAFVVQFTFLACFFWLNVMCFDIWWVFSGLMPMRGSIKEAEHKKFLIYSCYAWGGSLVISGWSAILDLVPGVPSTFIKPQFGLESCWFVKGGDAEVLYFYLPIALLITLNLAMFATTSCRLRTHTRDSKVLRTGDSCRHDSVERQRFNLYLKLFVLMGCPWVIELASFMVGGPKIIWLVPDFCNALQGLFIFIIFVCKRRILRLLSQRLCPRMHLFGPTPSIKNMSRTSSTQLSRTSTVNVSRKVSQNSDCIKAQSNV